MRGTCTAHVRAQSSRGFTTIEILVVVGILLIMLAVSGAIVSRTQISSQLIDTSDRLLQELRYSQVQSQARKNGDSYGVFVESGGYTLYQGDSYIGRDTAYDQVVDTGMISLLVLSGSSDFHFAKGSGIPSATGTILLMHPVYGSSTISFNEAGVMYGSP